MSTPDQSPERQIRELQSCAQARGRQIVSETQEVAGGSGKRPERENILRMDRLGRSVRDLVLIETLGVAFVVPGHIDITAPMGRMPAHFLAAVAEFERELIRERVGS